MNAMEILREHATEFSQSTGLHAEIVQGDGNRIFIVIRGVPLPHGIFQVDSTDVLFITDTQYPLSALDMFWTEVSVVRKDGSAPQSADHIENYLNRQWRRFSWHRNARWNPKGNGISDHYSFMESRWIAEAKG